jgi:large subunit ribosomal protein L15
MIKYMPDHFGVHGFKRDPSLVKRDKIINVGQLDERYHGKKEINLTKEGYDKLLGGGAVGHGYAITVKSASQKAIDKIAEQGGEVKIKE